MHLKYRPKTFEELFGHSAVKKALSESKLDRPILLIGLSGIGKTTIAYILANRFGCNEEGIIHHNCFHFSGIDRVREVVNDLNRSSLFSDKKVLILDEIHGLSAQAQQELLIPLENLSENVLVIACTTTIDKVKDTLVSRFISYNLLPLTRDEIAALLKYVTTEEGIHLTKPVKSLLLKHSEGIPRRLLTGLTKIKGLDDLDEIEYILQKNILEEEGDVYEFFKALMSGLSWSIISKKLSTLLKSNTPESIRVSLVNLIGSRILYSKDRIKDEKAIICLLGTLTQNVSDYLLKSYLIAAIYSFCSGEKK